MLRKGRCCNVMVEQSIAMRIIGKVEQCGVGDV